MALQLKTLLLQFDAVCEQKFGRTYDFLALEAHFRDHAIGKRHLTAKDVGKIFSAENTPFAKYWPRPHVKVLEEVLTMERVYVGPLRADSRALVQSLLSVFHNIGTVSLLLRFVHPERFGIFSTPVIHLL